MNNTCLYLLISFQEKVKVPVVCFDLMRALRVVFGGKVAMKVDEVLSEIQQHQYPSLVRRDSAELKELLSYLSIMGMVSLPRERN